MISLHECTDWQRIPTFFRIQPSDVFVKNSLMHITVNNQPMVLDAPCSLEQLLKQWVKQLNQPDSLVKRGMAMAVNRQIISRSQWADTLLNEGDSVTLIKATAGG